MSSIEGGKSPHVYLAGYKGLRVIEMRKILLGLSLRYMGGSELTDELYL